MFIIIAKKKLSDSKHPPTGGGAKGPETTQAEETVIANLDGRPSLEGISVFVDTGDVPGNPILPVIGNICKYPCISK